MSNGYSELKDAASISHSSVEYQCWDMAFSRQNFHTQTCRTTNLGCSDQALVEFMILRNIGLAKIKVRSLNFRIANFQMFKELLDEILWETLLRDKRKKPNWQLFKDTFLTALELSIPQDKKLSEGGKKSECLINDPVVELKDKSDTYT